MPCMHALNAEGLGPEERRSFSPSAAVGVFGTPSKAVAGAEDVGLPWV